MGKIEVGPWKSMANIFGQHQSMVVEKKTDENMHVVGDIGQWRSMIAKILPGQGT